MNKRSRVRKGIIPGNSRSLWKAVNVAKDQNSNEIPKSMFNEGISINEEELPECFAEYFENKVSKQSENVVLNPNVYNGVRKLPAYLNYDTSNFMTSTNIRKAVLSIKKKNSEGEDRIPQRSIFTMKNKYF